MCSAQSFLLDVFGALGHSALAFAAVGCAQILPHDTLLTALDATSSPAAVADAEPHAALDVGASGRAADSATAMSDAQPLALRAARAALALTPTPPAVANAESAGHGVTDALRKRAQLFLALGLVGRHGVGPR